MSSETVRVRIVVVIDESGNYAALGRSDLRENALQELVSEELDNTSPGFNTHMKYLEIDLPMPTRKPINLEAREDHTPPPQVKLRDS